MNEQDDRLLAENQARELAATIANWQLEQVLDTEDGRVWMPSPLGGWRELNGLGKRAVAIAMEVRHG